MRNPPSRRPQRPRAARIENLGRELEPIADSARPRGYTGADLEPRPSTLTTRQGLRAYPIATCIGASVVGLMCWIASSPSAVSAADHGRVEDAGWGVFRARQPIHLGTPDRDERRDVWGPSTPVTQGQRDPVTSTRTDPGAIADPEEVEAE